MWSIRRKRLCGISVKSRTHCSRLCSWCSKLPTSCCSAHTGCLHPPHRQWKYSTNTGHQPKEKDSGQNQAVGLFCETQLTTHRLGQRSLAYPFFKKNTLADKVQLSRGASNLLRLPPDPRIGFYDLGGHVHDLSARLLWAPRKGAAAQILASGPKTLSVTIVDARLTTANRRGSFSRH